MPAFVRREDGDGFLVDGGSPLYGRSDPALEVEEEEGGENSKDEENQ
jgi:hypothetical protein